MPASSWAISACTASGCSRPPTPGPGAWCRSASAISSATPGGLRLPTYTTLGFLHASLPRFAAAAIAATLVWTTGLFFISLKLGLLMMHYLGIWRWAGLAVFLIVIVIVGRLATRIYNKRTAP